LIKKPLKLFPAQQFNFAGEAVHPFPCFLREMNGRSDTLFYGGPVATGYQVVCMRNYLLFRGFRDTVPGRESKKRTFIGRKAGPGMAFHDPGQFFRTPQLPEEIRSFLGMVYRMGPAPADIVKHGSG
jgi:hypothetical protein